MEDLADLASEYKCIMDTPLRCFNSNYIGEYIFKFQFLWTFNHTYDTHDTDVDQHCSDTRKVLCLIQIIIIIKITHYEEDFFYTLEEWCNIDQVRRFAI